MTAAPQLRVRDPAPTAVPPLPAFLADPAPAGAPLAPTPSGPGAVYQAGTSAMHQPITSTARLRLMGANLDPVTPSQVMAFIARRAERGRKGVVANHNMHSLYLTGRSALMRAFYQKADLIQIDSIPLILWGKLLGHPIERGHRSTYLDWRDQFWQEASERRWRVFLLGSCPGVACTMVERIQRFWPGVELDQHHGYFDQSPDSAENLAVVAQINAFAPDVILVGMGMPIQEAWICQNEERLNSGVLLSVGGAFDYEAGVQIPAPRWLGQIGLEWLFRFAIQPRRLFSRYFVEPWSLMGAAMQDVREAARSRHRQSSTLKPRLSNPVEH
jgi:N-acetylglucosaminyldiphosphoundecaprenol N-acetyl-beta-D-mannosaminyltransferase